MAPSTVYKITRPELADLSTPNEAHITKVKHLASYNWIEAKTPTIAVPGLPPKWSNIKVQKSLPKDTGHIYIAQNAARHPDSPLEPLLRALFIEQPDFDIRKINLVSDRNNIRKLLSFVDPSTSRNKEDFTIRAEAAGKTVLLSREETKVEEVIKPNEFRGYGHEFEKAYTKEEIAGSTGHHRIVNIGFGDFDIIIRHEVDGYVADSPSTIQEEVDLLDRLNGLALDSDPSVAFSEDFQVPGSKLTIRKVGHPVSITSTLEIKTRVAHKPLSFDEVAPQLWTSQTPKLVRAYHNRGVFNVPVVENVTAELKKWEDGHQKALKELAALIEKILEVVKEHGEVMIKYRVETGILEILQGEDRKMLPKDLYGKWKDEEDQESLRALPQDDDLKIVDDSDEGDSNESEVGSLYSDDLEDVDGSYGMNR